MTASHFRVIVGTYFVVITAFIRVVIIAMFIIISVFIVIPWSLLRRVGQPFALPY
jgi:hypothetical protein